MKKLKKGEKSWNRGDKIRYKVISLLKQNDAIALILDGKEKNEIIDFLVSKYDMTPLSANELHDRMVGSIRQRQKYELQSIVEEHAPRYEKIYSILKEIGSNQVISALKAKEKLLQFHKADTHMRINNNHFTQVSTVEVKGDYDVSLLDEHQQERLRLLLDKAKINDYAS